MAAVNGRTPSCFGQAFMTLTVSGGPQEVVGQPFRVRGWGIPTHPGYRDRPEKWNVGLLEPAKPNALPAGG